MLRCLVLLPLVQASMLRCLVFLPLVQGLHGRMEDCLRQALAAGVGLRRDTCACIVESYAAAGKHTLALEALRVLPVLQAVHAHSIEAEETLPHSAEALLEKLDECEEQLEALQPNGTVDGPHLDEAATEPTLESALAFASWSHSLAHSMAPEIFKCRLSQLDFAKRIAGPGHS